MLLKQPIEYIETDDVIVIYTDNENIEDVIDKIIEIDPSLKD